MVTKKNGRKKGRLGVQKKCEKLSGVFHSGKVNQKLR